MQPDRVHSSEVTATWKGSFSGGGRLRTPHAVIDIALPAEFGGTGKASTPEDLLAGALASCFLVTFGIILEKAGVPYEHLSIATELRTQIGPPAEVIEIILHPLIISSAETALLTRLSEKVEAFCVISKSLNPAIRKTVRLNHRPRADRPELDQP